MKESAEKWEPKVRLTNRLYDLNVLNRDYIEKFIEFLESQSISYEIL